MAVVEQFFAREGQLPTMPEIARELMASFDRDDIDLRTLVGIVARDATLSAKVLRLANSARFSPTHNVANLVDAAALLGLDTLRNLAMAACVAGAFPRIPRLDRVRFWRHGMACGGYARWLGRLLGVQVDTAYLAGFMLRTGQILMAMSLPQMVADVESAIKAPDMRAANEYACIGCTHGDITAELAMRWNFPDNLVRGFRHAAAPLEAQPFSLIAALLCVANVLADAGEMGCAPVEALRASRADLVEHLNLDVEWIERHLPTFEELTEAVDALVR